MRRTGRGKRRLVGQPILAAAGFQPAWTRWKARLAGKIACPTLPRPALMDVAIDFFADDPVGGLIQVTIQRFSELLIFRPERAVHERLGSPHHHRRIALALVGPGASPPAKTAPARTVAGCA